MTQPAVSPVRIATIADHQECWRLLLQGHNEIGVFKLTPEKVNWWVQRLLNPAGIPPLDTGPRGVIGVIGETGKLQAICLLIIADYWYSNEKHLEELLVFVDPEYRASSHAKDLVGWMKHQADITGIPLLTGIVSNDRTEAKCRLYRRMVPKIGEFFLYLGNKGSVHSSSAVFV